MSTVLRMGSISADVEDLQRRLNCASPTRLPRLSPDRQYGVFTTARVMEFQFRQGLTVDGVAGNNTRGRLASLPTVCPTAGTPQGRCILVDLVHRRLTAFNNGRADLQVSPIMGGSPSDPSTRGVFPMTPRRLRHHTSSQFPFPPGNMDFSLFYHRGEAIHQGPPDEPSHGCIHVGPPHAEQVFNWAGGHDVLVIVVK